MTELEDAIEWLNQRLLYGTSVDSGFLRRIKEEEEREYQVLRAMLDGYF